MIGIAEMFAEYASAEADEFSYWFAVEQTAERTLIAKRNRERDRYRQVMTCPAYRPEKEHRREYKANWIREYEARKRRTDPVWAERRRKQNRERMARLRAARRECSQAKEAV